MTSQQSRRSRTGLALIWSAVIACPCHWPLLLVALAGGTAVGATLRTNFVLVFAASAAYFAIALGLGLRLVRRAHDSGAHCTVCGSSPATRQNDETSAVPEYVGAGGQGRITMAGSRRDHG